jgi:flagellar biosynthetic protein FlhB
MLLLGGALVATLAGMMRAALTLDERALADPSRILTQLHDAVHAAVGGFAPLLLVLAAAAFLAPVLVGGWLFSPAPLRLDWGRLSPAAALRRVFSLQGAVSLAASVLKVVIVAGAGAWALWAQRAQWVALAREPLRPALGHLGHILAAGFLSIAGALAAVALLDALFQLWRYARDLRMTPEEVRQELRETEPDPLLRARMRRAHREAVLRRLTQSERQPDVVVINPHRFAVALRYLGSGERAPRVVAKGAYAQAEVVLAAARHMRTPVLPAPRLARALYAHTDVGQEIPPALHSAVADVLAWVYRLRRHEAIGGERPREPAYLPVPAGLDPEAKP